MSVEEMPGSNNRVEKDSSESLLESIKEKREKITKVLTSLDEEKFVLLKALLENSSGTIEDIIKEDTFKKFDKSISYDDVKDIEIGEILAIILEIEDSRDDEEIDKESEDKSKIYFIEFTVERDQKEKLEKLKESGGDNKWRLALSELALIDDRLSLGFQENDSFSVFNNDFSNIKIEYYKNDKTIKTAIVDFSDIDNLKIRIKVDTTDTTSKSQPSENLEVSENENLEKIKNVLASLSEEYFNLLKSYPEDPNTTIKDVIEEEAFNNSFKKFDESLSYDDVKDIKIRKLIEIYEEIENESGNKNILEAVNEKEKLSNKVQVERIKKIDESIERIKDTIGKEEDAMSKIGTEIVNEALKTKTEKLERTSRSSGIAIQQDVLMQAELSRNYLEEKKISDMNNDELNEMQKKRNILVCALNDSLNLTIKSLQVESALIEVEGKKESKRGGFISKFFKFAKDNAKEENNERTDKENSSSSNSSNKTVENKEKSNDEVDEKGVVAKIKGKLKELIKKGNNKEVNEKITIQNISEDDCNILKSLSDHKEGDEIDSAVELIATKIENFNYDDYDVEINDNDVEIHFFYDDSNDIVKTIKVDFSKFNDREITIIQ